MANLNPPTARQNVSNVTKPNLKDAFDSYLRQIFIELNCHHLGTVVSFNVEQQTAKVSINYKKTYYEYTNDLNPPKAVSKDYPFLAECPVIVLGGGGANLTFPIKPGDQCVLLFNDRDIDNWWIGNNDLPNPTARLHNFTDAIALVGLKNLSNLIQNYDTVHAWITNGTIKVGINNNDNLATIENASTTLGTQLQNLCTQLENLATAITNLTISSGTFTVTVPALDTPTAVTGTSGTPVNAPTFSDIATQITNIATTLSNLLE